MFGDHFEIVLEETFEQEPVVEELVEVEDVAKRLQRYKDALIAYAHPSSATAPVIHSALEQTPSLASASDSSRLLTKTADCTTGARVTQEAWLSSLPLDIFLEIASDLGPLDLLRCSRTSKTLRSMLLSTRNRSLWQHALEAVPQLPPCPPDLSEIFFTALLFDDNCFACGAEGAHSTDYALRVRFCAPCWQEKICEGTTAIADIPKAVQDLVMMLTPCEISIDPKEYAHSMWRLEPAEHILQDYYDKQELVSLSKFFWPPLKLEEFALLRPEFIERTKYVLRRQAHAFVLHLWDARVRARHDGTAVILPTSQLNSLQYRCVSWELADIAVDRPEELDAVPGYIVSQLRQDYQERVKRQGAIYEERLQTRYGQLEVLYDELLKGPWSSLDQRLFPNRHDGARLLSHIASHDDARGTVRRRDFYEGDTLYDLRGDMGHHGDAYMHHLASLVASGIEAELGSEAASPLANRYYSEVLSMPCALFVCAECFAGPLAFPHIHVHWRKEHPDISVWRTTKPNRDPYASKIATDMSVRVKFWREGIVAVQMMLRAVGIVADATVAQLNKVVKSGRLHCSCGDPSIPDVSQLTWADLVFHVQQAVFWSCTREIAREKVKSVNKSLVLVDDHEGLKCLKYLTEDADTSRAHYRVRADSENRARIEAHLAERPEGAEIVCRICDALTDESGRDWRLTLESEADDIVYHFNWKHQKDFEENDVFFSDSAVYKRTVYTWD